MSRTKDVGSFFFCFDMRDLGKTCHDAVSVDIAQPPVDFVLRIHFGNNSVIAGG